MLEEDEEGGAGVRLGGIFFVGGGGRLGGELRNGGGGLRVGGMEREIGGEMDDAVWNLR